MRLKAATPPGPVVEARSQESPGSQKQGKARKHHELARTTNHRVFHPADEAPQLTHGPCTVSSTSDGFTLRSVSPS
jgi:hypothetical protein